MYSLGTCVTIRELVSYFRKQSPELVEKEIRVYQVCIVGLISPLHTALALELIYCITLEAGQVLGYSQS